MSDIGVMELVEADVGVSMRRVCVGQCVSEVNTDTVLQNARVKESRSFANAVRRGQEQLAIGLLKKGLEP